MPVLSVSVIYSSASSTHIGSLFNKYPATGPYMGREQFQWIATEPGGLVEALAEYASGSCLDTADQTFLLVVYLIST